MKTLKYIGIVILVLGIGILIIFFLNTKSIINVKEDITSKNIIEGTTLTDSEKGFMRLGSSNSYVPIYNLEISPENSTTTSFKNFWRSNDDLIKSMTEEPSTCADTYNVFSSIGVADGSFLSAPDNLLLNISPFFLTPHCIYAAEFNDKYPTIGYTRYPIKLHLIATKDFDKVRFLRSDDFGEYFLYENVGYYVSPQTGLISFQNFKEGLEKCNALYYYPSTDGSLIVNGKKTKISDSVCADSENDSTFFTGDINTYIIFKNIGSKNGIYIRELVGLNPSKLIYQEKTPNLVTDGVKTFWIEKSDFYGQYMFRIFDAKNIADISTFKRSNDSQYRYGTDSSNVYYEDSILNGADNKTFQTIEDQIYWPGSIGRDDKSLWYEDKKVMDVNASTTITYISSNWHSFTFTDGKNNYTYFIDQASGTNPLKVEKLDK